MTTRQTYAQTNLFNRMRRKAEVWIAWEAEICRLTGRPAPTYPKELLDYYDELGRPGNDEMFFADRPGLREVVFKT